MKKFTFVILVALVAFGIPLISAQTEDSSPPVLRLKLNVYKPIIADTLTIVAGQEVHFRNDAFPWVRIWSDFPLVVHAGACQATSTRDITCNIQPSQSINFQDLRIGVPADSVPVNRVRITALKHAPN